MLEQLQDEEVVVAYKAPATPFAGGTLYTARDPDLYLYAAHFLAMLSCFHGKKGPVDNPCQLCLQHAQTWVRAYVQDRASYDPKEWERVNPTGKYESGDSASEFFIPD
jgi:hypothetical protein